MKRATALRREMPAAFRIPYRVQLSPHVVRTEAGDYVQVFRLDGASFETADDEVLNNWHERLNVLWRNIAAPNVALWMHVIRRRERVSSTRPDDTAAADFAERVSTRYQARLSTETLMVNELYLSVAYRPIAGAAPNLVARLLSAQAGEHRLAEHTDALDACEKLAQTVGSSLARYDPERLGVYESSGRLYSRVLEFFGQLVNADLSPVPLPTAPLDEVLATTRIIFGSETIEYRLPTQTRFGAILGIKEYASPTTVGMYNVLLSAPFEFVLTQSFAFLTKAAGQGLLQRQYNQMANAGDFAVSQAEQLKDALDDLTSNDFVMGDHHFTLQVLTPLVDRQSGNSNEQRLKSLNDDVALARAILADTGMTTAREDLALEAATSHDELQLMGLDHPLVQEEFGRWRSLPPEEVGIAVSGDVDEPVLLSMWMVEASVGNGERRVVVQPIAVKQDGTRSPAVERLCDKYLQAPAASPTMRSEQRLDMFARFVEPTLQRELKHKGTANGDGSYSAELIGYVEIAGG